MQAEGTEQRKYVLTKVDAGDYLLPSNDRKVVWRIAKYEDGPSQGLDIPRDREFWGVWRWRGKPDGQTPLDPDDWDQWIIEAASCETRAEAIRLAMEMPPLPRKARR